MAVMEKAVKIMENRKKISLLMEKGVKIPDPDSVLIGEEVDPVRISGDNVVIYPGTRIFGKKTLIMSGAKLGFEAPVTIDNCIVGPEASLKGGFFQKAAFAGKNSFGSGAHVRGGTILEEEACAAHTVGLKQSILFPFVTLGSLINFCDCLMAGGTSRKDHSEVGSSFIHFNYTPNQDKATPSMFGNVPNGVMLNSRPVFLGGQGGVVGPCRLAFGSVTAAGTLCRRDELRQNRLIFGGALKQGSVPRSEGVYTNPGKIFEKNCHYIAGLIGLKDWYKSVRKLFIHDFFSEELLNGMSSVLDQGIDERIKRLEDFCIKLEKSKNLLLAKSNEKKTALINMHDEIINKWDSVKEYFILESQADTWKSIPEKFLDAVDNGIKENGKDYIRVMQSINPVKANIGTDWLESIEKTIIDRIFLSKTNQ